MKPNTTILFIYFSFKNLYQEWPVVTDILQFSFKSNVLFYFIEVVPYLQ